VAVFLAALVVAAAVGGAAARLVAGLKRGREDERRARELSLAALFAPAIAAVQDDPRALLTWQPLATTLRKRFAEEFAALDAASASTFPFNKDVLATAHSRWTAEWLAWEKAHDATYKLKALIAQHELGSDAVSVVGRARLEAIDREKLELYQKRYEDYVRVGKALHALIA